MSSVQIGDRIAHFELRRKLGSGGMGEVFEAFDTRLERHVAIKAMPRDLVENPESRARFEQEAKLLARISHGNIASIHEWIEDDGAFYLVLELATGRNLEQILKPGPLPVGEAIRTAIQIGEACEAAHRMRVVHRDLKPANVIVSDEGRVKVLDFGIAKALDELQGQTVAGGGGEPGDEEAIDEETGDLDVTLKGSAALTRQGTVVGTVPYMSPEQIRGKPVDERTDVWAFGCLIYEMLTGKRAFRATNRPDLYRKIVQAEIDWELLAELPGDLQILIERCLRPAPERRLQSIADARAQLDDFNESLSLGGFDSPRGSSSRIQTVATAGLAPPSRRRGANWSLIAGVSLVAVLLLGSLAWWWVGGRQQEARYPYRSVLVLPPQVDEDADAFLADAFASTVSNQLSRTAGFETRLPPSRVDVMAVDGDFARLAELYDASVVVQSRLQRERERVSVNVQLIAADSRTLVGGWQYTFPYEGFSQRLGRTVGDLLTELAPGADREPSQDDLWDPAAQRRLEEGIYLARRYRTLGNADDFRSAAEALEAALEIEPMLLRAAEFLAYLHQGRFIAGTAMAELEQDTRFWAQRALDLDRRSSTGWAVLSWLEAEFGERDEALQFALRAAAYGPRNPLAMRELSLRLWDYSAVLAVAATRAAVRMGPLDENTRLNEGFLLITTGQYEESLAVVDAVLLDQPEMERALLARASLLVLLDRRSEIPEAFAELDVAVREGRLRSEWVSSQKDLLQVTRAIRDGQGVRGLAEGGRDALMRMLRLARGEVEYPGAVYQARAVSAYLAGFGLAEEALDALDFRSRAGILDLYDMLLLHPSFGELRGDGRFAGAVRQAEGRFETAIEILDEARGRGELPAVVAVELEPLLQELSQVESAL